MKRVVTPELLDTDEGSPAEIEGSLADLRWLNRYFGGVTTTASLLREVAERIKLKQITFLDIAGASGDVAAAARNRLQAQGIVLKSTVLDRAPTHFAEAHLRNGTPSIVGDALQIPFHDQSFDVVGSSLFLHHLEPEQIIAFTEEALRVCRHAVIVNDLLRSSFHLATAYAGAAVYRSRITRNDAPASVRRAYTPEEMLGLLRKTNAARIDYSRHYFFRMGFVIWRKGDATND